MKHSLYWFGRSILLPFVITRLVLVIVGLVAPLVATLNTTDTTVLERGWFLSPVPLVDMWARWDSGWYLSVITLGYQMGESVYVTSNLAFFPVYPLLVKGLALLLSFGQPSVTLILACGILISNIFLLCSLAVLFRLTEEWFASKHVAQVAVWLVLVFPTSFFLSSVYTESTFLFFSLLSFWYAHKQQWWRASLAAALVGVTRPIGLLIMIPLLSMYAGSKQWRWRLLDRNILSFLLVPMGLILFFSYLYLLTGDFFAALKVQNAWGRTLTNPVSSFLQPTGYWPLITPLDQLGMLVGLVAAVLLMQEKGMHRFSLGIYSFLIIIPTLFTGTLDSATRFLVVVFPLCMYGASLLVGHRRATSIALLMLFVLQLWLFARFTLFYWAG